MTLNARMYYSGHSRTPFLLRKGTPQVGPEPEILGSFFVHAVPSVAPGGTANENVRPSLNPPHSSRLTSSLFVLDATHHHCDPARTGTKAHARCDLAPPNAKAQRDATRASTRIYMLKCPIQHTAPEFAGPRSCRETIVDTEQSLRTPARDGITPRCDLPSDRLAQAQGTHQIPTESFLLARQSDQSLTLHHPVKQAPVKIQPGYILCGTSRPARSVQESPGVSELTNTELPDFGHVDRMSVCPRPPDVRRQLDPAPGRVQGWIWRTASSESSSERGRFVCA
ncbi:hypothetical protein DFR68_11841 [Nocardia mexicana]|uniref:Uncharacterized protein n=1 Tax=Nocardia mexicana TaxID=279262 RepID=A0A370GJM5_9NOCA|nr:hypothetical protein DFR68_11841 [Nocardia mexicana]